MTRVPARHLVQLALFFALLTRPARADTPVAAPLASSLRGPAKDAYIAAKLLIQNGDFQGALTKLQLAYDVSKDPRLLYDMALCSKNLHAYARMQTLLRQYEREAGSGMPGQERAAVDSAIGAVGALVGQINLTVTPDGATVLVDGEVVGTTPFRAPILLDLGKHTVGIRLDGFESVERHIETPGGNVTGLAIVLVATAHVADLTIATDAQATVAVDGTVVGSGRYHAKVSAGPHAVHVTEPGKSAFDSQLELRDGETRTLEVTLREEKHAVIWPWVIGGVAVVAGGIVGGYFLFQSDDTTTPVPSGKLGVGSVQFNSLRARSR